MIHGALDEASHCPSYEAGNMDVIVTEQQDGLSDYGSDFTPDEEEILKGLLQQPPREPDNPITDPDLQLKDIDDEAIPKRARVSKLGYDSRLPSNLASENKIAIQEIGNGGNCSNSMFCATWLTSTN